MSQKLPVNEFKWEKILLMKNYADKDRDKVYIFEVDVKYPKDLPHFYSDLPLLLEGMTLLNDINSYATCMIKN